MLSKQGKLSTEENDKINPIPIFCRILQFCLHTHGHEILDMACLSVLAAGEMLSGVNQEISCSCK